MHNKLKDYLDGLPETITEERKSVLLVLVDYIATQLINSNRVRLNFICTHNSRRSHLSQVWAKTASFYYGIDKIDCYSGGTEATQVYPQIINTLKSQGFSIEQISQNDNPLYSIKYDVNENPIIGFSKKFDNAFNPSSNFCAVMTCSDADKNCPFIVGADQRIPLRYNDPKVFDNTELKEEKYLERSHEIASEMKYIFNHVNEKLS